MSQNYVIVLLSDKDTILTIITYLLSKHVI